MQAIRFHESGGPDVMRLEEAPDPQPGSGEVLIRVAAAGVNFYEARQRSAASGAGLVFPFTPGGEAAGVIVAHGPGLSAETIARLSVGSRVVALTSKGAYAQLVSARAASTYRVPGAIVLEEAAAIPLQGLTAYGVLRLAGRMEPGDVVLVHAAAGGVGSYAVQLARLLGASMVIGTAGSAEKLDFARSVGADVSINYREGDFAAKVRDLTNGNGANLILDSVAGEVFSRGLTCLAKFGRIVVFGSASGQPAQLAVGQIGPLCQSVAGFNLTSGLSHPWFGAHAPAALLDWIASGRVRVHVGRTFPLAQASDAHRLIEGRGTLGKIVLVVDSGLR